MMSNFKLLKTIIQENCPHCGQGSVFQKGKRLSFPNMKDKCELCNYHFDRESGYFIGAMYISYGMSVFQGIVAFLALYFLTDLNNPIWYILLIFAVVVGFSYKNYKLSRVIFMHIFPW